MKFSLTASVTFCHCLRPRFRDFADLCSALEVIFDLTTLK